MQTRALIVVAAATLACGHSTPQKDPAPDPATPVDARVDARPIVEGETPDRASIEEHVRNRFSDARPEVIELLTAQCVRLASVKTQEEGVGQSSVLADELDAKLSDQEQDGLIRRIKLLYALCFKFSPALTPANPK